MIDKVIRSDEEWREMLPDLAWRVTRKHETERPGSHPGFPSDPGTFRCLCCDAALFDQNDKYESHCGWPSFTQPLSEESVGHQRDTSHGMDRVEVHCPHCDAHLGHVFPDGPEPTGLRYCINGVALRFEAAD